MNINKILFYEGNIVPIISGALCLFISFYLKNKKLRLKKSDKKDIEAADKLISIFIKLGFIGIIIGIISLLFKIFKK